MQSHSAAKIIKEIDHERLYHNWHGSGRNHIIVILDANGDEIDCTRLINTKVSVKQFFKQYAGVKVAIETGTHSPWISWLLEDLGRVYVGNPYRLRVIWDSNHSLTRTRITIFQRSHSVALFKKEIRNGFFKLNKFEGFS